MFHKPTVFVLGAGASVECGLPLGPALAKSIAISLHPALANEGNLLTYLFEHYITEQRDDYIAAANELHSTLLSSPSVDDALNWLSGNPLAVKLGKIGIARSILGAEHSSVLSLANDPTEFAKFDQTWLHQFFAMAKRNLKREDLLKTFQNVTIINFNYDRCVEQYLFHAFHQRGAVSRDDARTVVRSLRMIRPYGALGSLWGELAFGDYSTNPISAADRILTLTEQLAQDVDDAIKKAILDAHVIVILGFGFHEQNMEALTVDSEYKHRNIFATLFGLDYQITGQVREHIGRAVKTDPPYVQGQQTVCGTFLRNFEIPILRAAA